jgi:hypothetical protein
MLITRNRLLAALTVVPLLVAGACGDDDDSASGDGGIEQWCAASEEIEQSTSEPTDDEWDALAEAAPDEIKDDVDYLIEKIKEVGDDEEAQLELVSDEEFMERGQAVEDFTDENCGTGDDGTGDDGGVVEESDEGADTSPEETTSVEEENEEEG